VIHALNRRRGYLLPTGAEAETIAAETDIWTYTVFLASLLRGIGKPTLDRTVKLFDARHRALGCWEPWIGAMKPPAAWYEISFAREPEILAMADRLAPLLVQQIVPSAGLKWLWSNRQALDCWISAISGDARSGGVLGEIIGPPGTERDPKESAQAVRSSPAPNEDGKPATGPRSPPVDATQDAEALQIEESAGEKPDDVGRKFLLWLQGQLRNGEIVVNDKGASVHRVSEGLLLISPDIFRDYNEPNWQHVQKRFLKLNLHRKSGPGNNFTTYCTDENPPSMYRGLLIPDLRTVSGAGPTPLVNLNLIENDAG
jgi:hypothetical protein